MRDFLERQTGHLTPPHLSYFSHWLLLCCLEAATLEAKNGRKRVWLQTVEERSVGCGRRRSNVYGLVGPDTFVRSEKSGSCIGNVRLDGPVVSQSEGTFFHRFQRSAAPQGSHSAGVGLSSGERVVVSDLQGHMVALATGHVCEVGRMWVSCTLDR